MVEDTHDGALLRDAAAAAGRSGRTPGRSRSARSPTSSPSSRVRVREAADRRWRGSRSGAGSAKFMKLTETQGAYASHPLGGCRMAASPGPRRRRPPRRGVRLRGPLLHRQLDHPDVARRQPVADDRGACRERCAEHLVRGAGDLGLPAAEVDPIRPVIARSPLVLAARRSPRPPPRRPQAGTARTRSTATLHQAGFEATAPRARPPTRTASSSTSAARTSPSSASSSSSRKEPARVAAAGDKCFYFQSDHWRGSVVQDDGTTKTYEWDGSYFFDKAQGRGRRVGRRTSTSTGGRQDPSDGAGHAARVRAAHGAGHRRRARRRQRRGRPALRRAGQARAGEDLRARRRPADAASRRSADGAAASRATGA